MRRYVPFLCCIAILTLLPASSQAALVKVYILTGQSNSLGTTSDPQETDYTPGTKPADADTLFFWSNVCDATTSIGDSEGQIKSLQQQQGYGKSPAFWGPEFGFARKMHAVGENNIMIIKAGRTGGGNTDWSKADGGHMYQQVVNTVNAALAQLTNAGNTFEIAGLLYLQGENDTLQEASISGSRLSALVDNLRDDLPNTSNMRTVIGGIAMAGANCDIVRAQQAALDANSPNIDYFSNLDLVGGLYDNIHFDKPSKLIVGERYADHFLAGEGRAAFICDFEEPVYSTSGGTGALGTLNEQRNWRTLVGTTANAKVSTDNAFTGSQSLKLSGGTKVGKDLTGDFGDDVTIRATLSRENTETGGGGGLFVYLGADGVNDLDFGKVATQFGLGDGVVTYRDGESMVAVGSYAVSEWYTFEATIHYDTMDPDGGSYDLKITSSDPNWSDFTTTNIKFRGGSAAVGAEDVLINRFNIPGTTPAWVDDLSISSTIVPEPSTITFLAGLSCQVFLRPFRLGVTGTVLEVAEEAQETNRER